MIKASMIAMLICMAFSQISFAQDTAVTDATLKSATVYFGYGAELTHRSSVKVNPATRQIVISGVAHTADFNSFQVSLPESIALLSQKYRVYSPTRPVITDTRLFTRYNDTIKLFQKEIARINSSIEIETSTMEKTNHLIELIINNNGNKTTTSDEALKLINACTGKIEKAKSNIFRLNNEKIDLNEKISQIQLKIYELNNVRPEQQKPIGQIILQVKCSKSEEIPIDFSYFTNNAGFTPLYDLRVNTKNNEMKIVYKAGIYQTTGIDWNQAKLTLSTANPNWSGTAPILNPWYLQVFQPQIKKYELVTARNGVAANTIPGIAQDRELSEVVVVGTDNKIKTKSINLNVDPSTLGSYTTLNENQLNTTYEIELPYDIKTDGEMQSVNIKEEKIVASLKNYAVPKLNRDAFLLAEIADWETLNLLPGVANIIMDDTYLGRTQIDPNISADTMNISLGKDRRVVINRVKLKESTATKRNNSSITQTFTYEITVKNNKSTDVDLILKDQFPLSQVKEVEVKLLASDSAAINEELGVLTWNLQLKAGESKKFRISYSVKYPSDKKIANL